MIITSTHGSLPQAECDVLIVNLFDGVKEPTGGTGAVNEALGNLITEELIKKDEFKGKLGKIGVLPTYGKIPARKVVVIGLGKQKDFDLIAARKVSAEAIKACIALKAQKACTILHGASQEDLCTQELAKVLAEGATLATYKFDKYKSKKDDEENKEENIKKEIEQLTIIESDESKLEQIASGIAQGVALAEATNLTRDLANEPAGYLTPTKMAEVAESLGLECNVYDKEWLEQQNMGSFLGVSQGSVQPPKFIHLKYSPECEAKKKICIVGKGITFDSGGLNLKPASGMLDMKKDMSGAAATLGIMKAIKELKPQVEVHGIVPTCENMPDGKAYKPGDVLTAKNGKTIEVNNTDAEGRLILADALTYAAELEPDQIIDIATLTGAVVVALGPTYAGIMGNVQEDIDKFLETSRASGEKLWQLPLDESYKETLKSDIADLQNIGSGGAGSSIAGQFLQEFISDKPWIHIDIAGVAWNKKPAFENPKGCTGFAVRSIVYYLMNI